MVRKDLWGYADDEALTATELHKIKYEVGFCWIFTILCMQFTGSMFRVGDN